MKLREVLICNIDKYKQRDCFGDTIRFLKQRNDKILLLYGLRRTGKTTLMKQLGSYFGITSIYEVAPDNTMEDVYLQLDECMKRGDKVVFIDEITNAKDFIQNSAVLADVYAACGMNIVVAGTDSLGLLLATDNELYDRAELVNTTYIPFAEHCRVLDTNDIDDYIRYGGLMNKEIAKEFLKTPKAVKRYLDSSVCDNIAHSLRSTNYTAMYTETSKYRETDLSLIIRKTVELYNGTINYNFLNSELESASIYAPVRDAIKKSKDLAEKQVYRKADRKTLIKEYTDAVNLSCNLERPATEKLVTELTDILFDLNFLSVFKNTEYNNVNGIWVGTDTEEYYIIQPAIKYALLKEAQKILLNSSTLSVLTEQQKTWLSKQIENNIFGDMTEAIVIFETSKCLDEENYLICKTTFRKDGRSIGEYDMLIYDREKNSYWGFEIKHTTEPFPKQEQHITNPFLREIIDEKYGSRENVAVLYRGTPFRSETGTFYFNITDFMTAIHQYKNLDLVFTILAERLVQKDSYQETDLTNVDNHMVIKEQRSVLQNNSKDSIELD